MVEIQIAVQLSRHFAKPPDVIGKSGSAVQFGSEKTKQTTKAKFERKNDKKKQVEMWNKDIIYSWLLPCSLRSNHIANTRLKMGFAIFCLYPPTTLLYNNLFNK